MKAIFLDRDGTVLNERGYLGSAKKMKFYPTALKGLRRLHTLGYKLIIVSNQSGVARGYFSLADLKKVNQAFTDQLRRKGVSILKIYFCPHAPDAGCRCRKPNTGMVKDAARDFSLDLKRSFLIGDQDRDMELARRVGVRPILVLTGAGRRFHRQAPKWRARVSSNLDSASRWIAIQST